MVDEKKDSNELSCLIRTIPSDSETILDIAQEDGVRRIEFNRRKLLPEMRSEPFPLDRAPARAHTFHEIEAFGKYVARESYAEKSVVLADSIREEIIAVLNEADGFQHETITFKPTIHPLFSPWLALLDRAIPVLDFGLFCSKYRRVITKPDGREVALMFQQIKVAKTIEINKGVGAKSLNGIMIQTDIAGQKGTQIFELPETIEIRCPIYVGGEPQVIPIDVLVNSRGDDVVVYATCPELAIARVEAFDAFVTQLSENHGDNFLIGRGSVGSVPWKTIIQS